MWQTADRQACFPVDRMMTEPDALRPNEQTVPLPNVRDASLVFIGTIHTPWRTRQECPRQGRLDGPLCRIVIDPRWSNALDGIEQFEEFDVLYWLHQARRDLVRQSPAHDGTTRGTFALRSPMRPNPIGLSRVRLIGREGSTLSVQGLDCIDGTPLIDLKPDRCRFSPQTRSEAI